jgi:hypothetical protein
MLGQGPPKVVEQDGHLSPVMVKITFLNGTSRTVMLRGFGYDSTIHSHQFVVRTDDGASARRLWIDSIAALKGTGAMRTRSSEFTVVLKDGIEVSAQLAGSDCEREINPSDSPDFDCSLPFLYNNDDSDQKVDLKKLKTVEFLAPVRKDKTGKAMFDTWRYSPYTGEKLPQP